MKKIVTIVCTMALGISTCIASNSAPKSTSTTFTTVELPSAAVNVPTGVFFNGSNFIKVTSTWVRIAVGGQGKEYSFTSETDPYGNYVLKLGNGECITIYSNGRSLYYNGATYSKK
ncbi:MAG: hypothetical protein IJY03_08060 [Prevotella sp.]|nr:hypothetical protein [Prevotella sp.]